MLSARRVFQGGVHTVTFHVPSLLREVVADGASRFALVHNHPSGDPSPSQEDILMTERVARAAAVIGVPLADHVVVSARAWQCVPFRAA
jgi:DNA repair protein RadC